MRILLHRNTPLSERRRDQCRNGSFRYGNIKRSLEDFSVEQFHGQLPSEHHGPSARLPICATARTRIRCGALPDGERGGLANAEVLSGKEMSFNNYVDADAAWELVSDFEQTACAIIKHTNPAGVGLGRTAAEAYTKALATDPVSAFGGIVAFNRTVDAKAAQEVIKIFTEVVIAPDYEPAALEILRTKKNLRVLRLSRKALTSSSNSDTSAAGCWCRLLITTDSIADGLKVVTTRAPMKKRFARFVRVDRLQAYEIKRDCLRARGQTVGVGAGQMSRVDSVKIGAMRAQLPLRVRCWRRMRSFRFAMESTRLRSMG